MIAAEIPPKPPPTIATEGLRDVGTVILLGAVSALATRSSRRRYPLTAAQNLRLHAELYGVDKALVGDRMRQVIEMVGLWERRGMAVRTFSGGMQRRLEIARGLMHSPRVLFLDEPTVGLDPQTRRSI